MVHSRALKNFVIWLTLDFEICWNLNKRASRVYLLRITSFFAVKSVLDDWRLRLPIRISQHCHGWNISPVMYVWKSNKSALVNTSQKDTEKLKFAMKLDQSEGFLKWCRSSLPSILIRFQNFNKNMHEKCFPIPARWISMITKACAFNVQNCSFACKFIFLKSWVKWFLENLVELVASAFKTSYIIRLFTIDQSLQNYWLKMQSL